VIKVLAFPNSDPSSFVLEINSIYNKATPVAILLASASPQ